MCNACGFQCCAYDGFSGCGCDGCPEPDCWSDDNDFYCESDDDWDDDPFDDPPPEPVEGQAVLL